jgi:SSS family solute:Na+ symporter
VRLGFFFYLSGYFVLLLLVSFIFSKRMKNLEDFFLASRRLPAFLVFFSLCASWFGAATILVSTDQALDSGLSSFWVMGAPAVITVLLLAFFLACPIRRLPIVSLPDLVEMRYGRAVRHLASLLIVWYMAVLAASQMVAIGQFLKSFLALPYIWCLVLGTGVVLVYSVFGGFLSVALTDALQFILLVSGVVGLFFFLLGSSSLGETSILASELEKAQYFNFFYDLKRNLLIVLSFTLAWTISPIAWQRIQAARTDRGARQGLFASSAAFLLLYWILVLIGMLSLPLFFSTKQEGPLLSAIIASQTGAFLSAVLFVAVVAAVMSTMDTAINTGALSLTRDVYQQIFPSRQGKEIVLAGRLSTILVGGAAFLIATRFQNILETLGLASEIMAEGLFIPGIAMVFLRKRLPLAGFFSLFLGGGFSVAGFLCELNLLPLSWPSWPYSVPYGLGLSLAGFLAGYGVERYLKKGKKRESHFNI